MGLAGFLGVATGFAFVCVARVFGVVQRIFNVNIDPTYGVDRFAEAGKVDLRVIVNGDVENFLNDRLGQYRALTSLGLLSVGVGGINLGVTKARNRHIQVARN